MREVLKRVRDLEANSVILVGHCDMFQLMLEYFGRDEYYMANAEVRDQRRGVAFSALLLY